jgi:hypothetical protein
LDENGGGSSKRRRIWGKFREMLARKLELGSGGEEMGMGCGRREATAAQFFRGGGGRLLRGGNFKFSRFGREHVSMWPASGGECVSARCRDPLARVDRFRDAEIGRRPGMG